MGTLNLDNIWTCMMGHARYYTRSNNLIIGRLKGFSQSNMPIYGGNSSFFRFLLSKELYTGSKY